MTSFKKLFVLLFLLACYASANAAVGDINTGSCSVHSETDESDKGKEGEGEGEDEEPDCE